ncbi:hypothetical protein ACH4U7_21925 [Streptomyces sp. NPDC020845]|uniref:hypothetical protein n=1 Tax=Streptomyces sp. NPDC020845 TaxID=3365096 RepID=UPI0037A4F43C
MSRQSKRLQQLAERDGITIHEAVPTAGGRWKVSLTYPLADPRMAELARIGATQIAATWPYVNDVGGDEPHVGHVLEQWLQLAAGLHPMHELPLHIQQALQEDLDRMLKDDRGEYLQAAGIHL